MDYKITVTEASRNFSDVLNRVAYRGEAFVLERGGKAVARLVPVPQAGRIGELPALLETVPRLGPKDAEALGRDIEAARDSLPPTPDPWGS